MEEKKCNDLVSKLVSYKTEGLKWKTDKRIEHIWKPEHDEMLENIDEWIAIAEDQSEEIAETYFKKSALYGKATFLDYILSTGNVEQSMNLMRLTNKSSSKIKTNRTTSKIDKCKFCGSPTQICGNKMKCTNPSCGEVEEITSKILKQKANGMKHTRNKIEMLIGRRLPPNKIERLYPLVKIWLTNLNYCYDWLHYQETFSLMKNKKTVEQWRQQFRAIYQPKPHVSFGDMIIPEVKEAAWTYLEYKMLIIEFHAMLKECDRLASRQEYVYTNMSILDDDEVLEIMQAYYEQNKKVPKLTETFEYKGKMWDIGNFINLLKLSNDVESEFHQRINEVFHENLHIPGLMCNFLAQPVKTVERFSLTEGYGYIIHKVFKIAYIQMPESDIERILELIQAFDTYVQKQEQLSTKKSNSKLYVCKLRCIFQIPYFYKYHELANYLPVKSKDTTAKIMSKWNLFETTEGKDIVDPYYVIEEEEKPAESGRQLFSGLR